MARRHVALIVRTEVRRRIRAANDDPRKALAYGITGIFGAIGGLVMVGGAYVAGRAVASGDVGSPLSVAAPVSAFVLALVLFLTGIRAVQRTALPDHAEALLLSARHRDVVTALLVVESLLPLGLVGLPGLLASLAFAVGSGSSASAVLVAVSVLLLVCLGAASGIALGFVVRNAIARSRLLARYKSGIGFLLVLAYLWVIYGTGSRQFLGPVVRLAATTPLRWFADLALLAVVPGASPVRAGAVVLASGVLVVGLWAATVRLAGWLWYTSPVRPRGEERESSIGGLPGVGRQTGQLVRKSWTRARRSPIRLVYVVYPMFAAVGPIASSSHGGVPAIAATILVLYGAWATGSAFTLNPIGDETPVLPVTLTSSVSGRQFVGALWLAGSAVGVPVTVALAVVVGVLAGLGPVDLGFVALLGVGLPALAPGVASGIGAAFPRVQPAQVTRGRRAVVPSTVAFGGYSLALLGLSAPAWLALDGSIKHLVATRLGVPASSVAVVGAVAAVGLVGLAAAASFRYAAWTFDGYSLA